MNLSPSILSALTVLFYVVQTEATICAPLSNFKIDCDDCQCSEDGTQYSCQVGVCGSSGYLNPNAESENSDRQSRNVEIPYKNDEIPPPGEDVMVGERADGDDSNSNGEGYNFYIIDRENEAEPIDNAAMEDRSDDDNADQSMPYRLRRSYVP